MATNIQIILILFIGNSFQYVRDESFLKFCDNVGGRKALLDISGDTCIVTWPFPTADLEEAEEYCKTWGAYPLEKFERNSKNQPVCTYINVYECRHDYTLIKGHCYRMVKKDMHLYDKAKGICGEQTIGGKKIVQMFKLFYEDQLRFIRAYFSNLRGFWVQEETNPKTKEKMVNRAAVFGMAGLYKGVGPGDVIQLPKNTRAQVMCYYNATETPLSFAAKARMLGEHYFPTVLDAYMVVWRTAGYYSAMISGDRMEAQKKCESSMRAIVGPGVGTVWDATKDNVKRLTPKFKQCFIQSYLPFFHCYWYIEHWTRSRGTWYTYYNKHYRMPKDGSSQECQYLDEVSSTTYGATWHTPNQNAIYTVSLYSEPTDGYNVRERFIANYAPILCTISFTDHARPTKCSAGWTPVTRGYTRVVCHKLYEEYKNFDQAQLQCEADQASLSTFTTETEYELLKTLGNKALTNRWLGYRKKEGCPKASQGKCELPLIVEFVNDEEDMEAARKLVASKWLRESDGSLHEPNNFDRDEMCVELRDTQFLNDYKCDEVRHFACMKTADVV